MDNLPDVYSRLVGVFHADGDLKGEFRYLTGQPLSGTDDTKAHCALCDITHGCVTFKRVITLDFSPKDEWKKGVDAVAPMKIELLHRNEQDEDLAAFTKDKTPCFVGKRKETGDWEVVLGDDELETCSGSVEAFKELLVKKLSAK